MPQHSQKYKGTTAATTVNTHNKTLLYSSQNMIDFIAMHQTEH